MASIWTELKRRKVVKVALAYAVVGWLLIEVASVLIPTFQGPEWVMRAFSFAIIAGFPLAVALAWAFDITTDGIKVASDEQTSESITKGAIDLAGMPEQIALATYETDSTENGGISSVAVLPFANQSGDTEGEYLSDGISESIINILSRISKLRVIPRASAFRHKSSSLETKQICQELGVQTAVTGSVKHYDDQLVVQAELVDVHRGAQIWGEHYVEPWENLFNVQEEIATAISRALKPELTGAEQEHIQRRDTEHIQAYQDYIRGRFHWNKRTVEGLDAAAKYFGSAINQDPRYAAAFSGLADTYNIMGYYSVRSPDETYPLAKVANQNALKIEPDLADAYASLGYATLFYDRDWNAARNNFAKAINLNPKYGTAHQWYAWYYVVQERFDEALSSFQEAISLDPLSLIINDHLAYGYMLVGKMDEARQQIDGTRALNPTYPLALWRLGDWHLLNGDYTQAATAYAEAESLANGHYTLGYLGLALGEMGKVDEARQVLARLDRYQSQRYVSPLDRAFVHAGLGEMDAAFGFIQQALDIRVSDMVRFKLLPWPDRIKSDPRFSETIIALNLTP